MWEYTTTIWGLFLLPIYENIGDGSWHWVYHVAWMCIPVSQRVRTKYIYIYIYIYYIPQVRSMEYHGISPSPSIFHSFSATWAAHHR
jgi:hypothetical protein